MTDKTKHIIHIVYDVIMSLMLAACGIAFSVACYSIYTSGETRVYTYESIGAAFDRIDVIVYITLALIVIGALLSILLPRNSEQALRAEKRAKTTCLRLQARVDLEIAPTEDRTRILSERKLRRGLRIALIVLIVAEAVLPLIYLLDPHSFPAVNGAYNREVLHALLVYLGMLSPLAVYGIVCAVLMRRSYIKETDALKNALKYGATAPAEVAETPSTCRFCRFLKENKKPILLGARITLLGCAAVFIVVGIVNGGMRDVLVKAVNICAECIGLG